MAIPTMSPSNDSPAEFRRLHESGCFVMPNPWDVGSARVLEQLGFPALATTSSGLAWSLGRRDNSVSRNETIAHLRAMAEAVDVPINADFEDGFATMPSDIARNVKIATTTGIAGLSIEDSTGDESEPLFEFALAVERISAARRRSMRAAPAFCSPPGLKDSLSDDRISPRRSVVSRPMPRQGPIACMHRASRRLRRSRRSSRPSRRSR